MIFLATILSLLALTPTRFCLPKYGSPPSPLSDRTLRRTPAPKVLVVTAGPSAEALTSYRPR